MKAFIIFLIVFFTSEFANADSVNNNFLTYKVKKGDTISKIVPKDKWELFKKINKIDERHLRIGMEVLIPVGNAVAPVPSTLKRKNNREVVIFLEKQYFGAYEKGKLVFWGPVSTGKKGYETPRGKFKALWKSKNYVSKKYKAKMPFSVCFSNSGGYFLHQQAMPGKPASHGCVRLLLEDAQRIFNWIRRGDPITIL